MENKQCHLKNKTLKTNNQWNINSATVKRHNIKQATLKSALLKQYNMKNFINRKYTHISIMLENLDN